MQHMLVSSAIKYYDILINIFRKIHEIEWKSIITDLDEYAILIHSKGRTLYSEGKINPQGAFTHRH